jgi:hypothetical protein
MDPAENERQRHGSSFPSRSTDNERGRSSSVAHSIIEVTFVFVFVLDAMEYS